MTEEDSYRNLVYYFLKLLWEEVTLDIIRMMESIIQKK